MASCFSHVAISGGSLLHPVPCELSSKRFNMLGGSPRLALVKKSAGRNLSVCAEYHNGNRSVGGGDFIAGFLLGGAVFGTLAYVFAPQIRRSLLNEYEDGFQRARRPVYYDDGLEKTRQTLNEKISQLNSAIDNVSSRLRGGIKAKAPAVPVEADPEVEATM